MQVLPLSAAQFVQVRFPNVTEADAKLEAGQDALVLGWGQLGRGTR